jgi:hypothetical protein
MNADSRRKSLHEFHEFSLIFWGKSVAELVQIREFRAKAFGFFICVHLRSSAV